MHQSSIDLQTIVAALAQNGGAGSSDFDLNSDARPVAPPTLSPAAVLIALRETDGGFDIYLTKRSSALKNHPGQIAFPGGKVDPGDSGVIAAALREAAEEISLYPSNVEVIGELPPHETVTGFSVTPIVGIVGEYFEPVPEMGEVEDVFTVPLNFLADRSNYGTQSRKWQGADRYYYVVPYGPYYIWGATARILRALAERLAT